MLVPRRGGGGHRTGGRGLFRIRNRCKKMGFFPPSFRARGKQAIVLARRPNFGSESVIWRRIGLPKQRPTAVGRWGGGRGEGGSAVEKGEVVFHIRATDDTYAKHQQVNNNKKYLSLPLQ